MKEKRKQGGARKNDDVSQRDTDVPLSVQNIDNQSYKKIKANKVAHERTLVRHLNMENLKLR